MDWEFGLVWKYASCWKCGNTNGTRSSKIYLTVKLIFVLYKNSSFLFSLSCFQVVFWFCDFLLFPNIFFKIRTIHGTTGKLKRAVLQFTPESWTPVRWLDPCCSYMRFLAVCQLVIFWQIAELNTFFIKHIFETPPAHNINLCRLALLSLIVAPSLR